MRTTVCVCMVAVCVLVLGMTACGGERIKFGVGLAYVDGFRQVGETLEDRLNEIGYATDLWNVPVGLDLLFYYQFEHGSMLALDIGPAALLTVSVVGGPHDGDYIHADFPVGLSYGYMLFPGKRVSPYFRVGVKQHFGFGDFRDSSAAGVVAGGGLTLFNEKMIQAQFEVVYDTTKDTYDAFGRDEEITINGLIVSAKAVF